MKFFILVLYLSSLKFSAAKLNRLETGNSGENDSVSVLSVPAPSKEARSEFREADFTRSLKNSLSSDHLNHDVTVQQPNDGLTKQFSHQNLGSETSGMLEQSILPVSYSNVSNDEKLSNSNDLVRMYVIHTARNQSTFEAAPNLNPFISLKTCKTNMPSIKDSTGSTKTSRTDVNLSQPCIYVKELTRPAVRNYPQKNLVLPNSDTVLIIKKLKPQNTDDLSTEMQPNFEGLQMRTDMNSHTHKRHTQENPSYYLGDYSVPTKKLSWSQNLLSAGYGPGSFEIKRANPAQETSTKTFLRFPYQLLEPSYPKSYYGITHQNRFGSDREESFNEFTSKPLEYFPENYIVSPTSEETHSKQSELKETVSNPTSATGSETDQWLEDAKWRVISMSNTPDLILAEDSKDTLSAIPPKKLDRLRKKVRNNLTKNQRKPKRTKGTRSRKSEKKPHQESDESDSQKTKKRKKPIGFLRWLDEVGRQPDEIVDDVLNKSWDRLYRKHRNFWQY